MLQEQELGYGTSSSTLTSSVLDTLFFSLFEEQDDPVAIVNELFEKQYARCKLLDFRLLLNLSY
jgi:hypothetical protein